MLTIKNTGLMKKIYLVMVVAATLASCNNDEIVNEAPKTPITFGNTFVENATRAIDNTYTPNTLSTFKVYGTIQGLFGDNEDGTKINIFKGIPVTKGQNNNWTYESQYTQYWVPDSEYEFVALVDADATVNTNNNSYINSVTLDNVSMPISISYNVNTQKDILYASATETLGATDTKSEEYKVPFSFSHLLSKVHFTFTNQIATNKEASAGVDAIKYSYKVSKIKIENAITTGTCSLSEALSWNPSVWDNNTTSLSFGNASNASNSTEGAENPSETAIDICSIGGTLASATSHKSMLLIPTTYDGQTHKLQVTFDVELFLNGTKLRSYTERLEVDKSVTFVAGNAYNLQVGLPAPGLPIQFTATALNEWLPKQGLENIPLTDTSTPSTPGEGE